MEMDIVHDSDELGQIALSGRLDLFGTEQIEDRFLDHTARIKRNTIVDMAGVSYVSSMGIRMILNCAKSLRESGAKLILVNLQESVKQVLQSVKISELIPMVNDMDEALNLLRAD